MSTETNTTQNTADEKRPDCGCGGMPAPGAMCGALIVSDRTCGAGTDVECRFKVVGGDK